MYARLHNDVKSFDGPLSCCRYTIYHNSINPSRYNKRTSPAGAGCQVTFKVHKTIQVPRKPIEIVTLTTLFVVIIFILLLLLLMLFYTHVYNNITIVIIIVRFVRIYVRFCLVTIIIYKSPNGIHRQHGFTRYYCYRILFTQNVL